MSSQYLIHPKLGQLGGVSELGGVESFLGVPYGLYSERWQAATLRGHLGTFDATSPGPQCPQLARPPEELGAEPAMPRYETVESEFECLNLNITRPLDTDADARLPVWVWFHGGAFAYGSASDSLSYPACLVQFSAQQDKPIIVVGVNYRLGPFGFLYSSDLDEVSAPGSPRGNLGLHDQRLALEWVQQNIAGFGGDPNQVTIGGQSSGGYAIHAQVSAQTHSTSSPVLFQQAIVHSGPLASRHLWKLPRLDAIWRRILDAEGSRVLTKDAIARVDALKAVSPQRLVELAAKAAKVGTWGVFVDGVFAPPETYSPELDILPLHPRVDRVMIGDCADERSVFLGRARARGLEPLVHALNRELGPVAAQKVIQAYGLDRRLDAEELVTVLSYVAQDMRYTLPTEVLATAWTPSVRFHVSLPNKFEDAGPNYKGMAHHGADLLYLFRNYNDTLEREGLTIHRAVSDSMGLAWLDFLYGKDPWANPKTTALHISKTGARLVERKTVWENPITERSVALWGGTGLRKAGRIANQWMSEQDDRADDDVYIY